MSSVNEKAKRGIKLLMARQVVLQVFTFAGGVVLARILDPAEFGLYAIASFLVQAFSVFGSFGLAPSLIQRKEELTEHDLQVGFTLQQIITTLIVAVLLLTAPWLASLYPKAPPETVWLVRALAFSLFLTSWRAISALQLERRLQYDKVALVELVEALSYLVLSVGLALAGFGVWSFVWATLIRGVLGGVIIYAAAPWPMRFQFEWTTAKALIRFGFPFQIGFLINNIGSWITPTVVAGLIGPQAVGYLSWASSNGKKPLMLVNSIMRVAFPHFARIQHEPGEVERLMTRYLTFLLLPAGAWFAVLASAGPSLVEWIYTNKWQPAVPALILSALAVSLDVVIWVVSVTLNSTGKVGFAANRSLLRTILNIGSAIPMVYFMGFNGVPVSYLISSAITLPQVFSGFERGVARRVLLSVAWTVLPGLIAPAAGVLVAAPIAWRIGHALVATLCSLLVYAVVTWITAPDWLKASISAKVPLISALRHRFAN